jgi:alkylhydroperoxidase family enzyme
VSAWRESPFLSEAECAALALAEAMTRIADSSDPVPDDVWAGVTAHYDEQALAALVLHIAVTNVYNRLNVTVRQVPGTM